MTFDYLTANGVTITDTDLSSCNASPHKTF